MSTVILHDDKLRLYAKGSFENIIQKCTNVVIQNATKTLSMKWKADIEEHIVSMSKNCHKIVAIGYKDFEKTELPEVNNLTLIAVFGIQNSVRIDLPEAIRKCKTAGIAARIVTGDSIEIAKAIAKRSGIVTEAELKSGIANLIMKGKELEECIGGLVTRVNEETGIEVKAVKNEYKLMNATRNLKVLAKALPSHKLALVIGLKSEASNTVLATGSYAIDQEILQIADIGLASQNSSYVAKETADAILTTNNISSVVSGIKWGRNVFQGMRKQMQFVIIANMSAILTACIGCLLFGETLLSPLHLLWINIITNVFSTFCLPSDPSSESILESKPYSLSKPLINSTMWNSIIIITGYQITLLTFFMLFGNLFFSSSMEEDVEMNWFIENKKLGTVLFTVYIYSQVVTLFCCRAIKPKGSLLHYL